MRVPRKKLVERMEEEIRPLLDKPKYSGGYDCCGCSTYSDILDHAERIVLGRGAENGDPAVAF